jgi:PleD family two-component response regulator
VGIAQYHAALETPEDLVAEADRALYAAKRLGRNRVAVAEPPVPHGS